MDKLATWFRTDTKNRVRFISRALLSGLLMGVGFPYPFLWPCAFFGIALFYYICIQHNKTRVAFLSGYLSGLLFLLCVFAPLFFSTFPLPWFASGTVATQLAILIALSILLASLLALVLGFCALFIARYNTNSWFDVFLVPAVWVVSELISSLLFSVVLMGKGSSFSPHVTVWYIGYLAANDSVLLETASIGGVYALSFVVVLCGVLCARFFISQKWFEVKKYYGWALVGIVCVVGLSHAIVAMRSTLHQIDTSKDGIYVGIVSTYQQASSAQDELLQTSQYEKMSNLLAPLRDVELLVLPEHSGYLNAMDDGHSPELLDLFRKIGRGGVMPIVVDSESVHTNGGLLYERAALFKNLNTVSYSERQLLLPFGGYIPSVVENTASIFGLLPQQKELFDAHSYSVGSSSVYTIPNRLTFGLRFGEELISPFLYSLQTHEGARLLVNQSSLSWAHGSHIVYQYLLRMAKVRAVESDRWFIRSDNMSPAYVLDNRGAILVQTSWYQAEAERAYIHVRSDQTLYVRYGLALVLPFLLVIVAIGVVCRYLPSSLRKFFCRYLLCDTKYRK